MPDEAEFFSEFVSAFAAGPDFDIEETADDEVPFEGSTCSKLKRSGRVHVRSTCSKGTTTSSSDDLALSGSSEIAVVRSGGVFNLVASFGQSSLETIRVAGAAVAALFIILDLVDGEFKAAAFGAAGLGAGLVAGLLVSGPVGLFFGAAVGVLFTLLPGLFDAPKEPGQTNNPAQIIQYAFFGDREVTGKLSLQCYSPFP
jgi:hypothetical protein